MVVHVVLMQLRPGVAEIDLSALGERVRGLADSIAGPGSSVIGANATDEPLTQGYEFGFVLRFADRGELDAYHVNPAHLGISLAIRDLAETVLVFDCAS
ncbi:MAG: Dabb family protein [Thermomicrobiales bacterium]